MSSGPRVWWRVPDLPSTDGVGGYPAEEVRAEVVAIILGLTSPNV